MLRCALGLGFRAEGDVIVLLDGSAGATRALLKRGELRSGIFFLRICENDSWSCCGRAAGDRSGSRKTADRLPGGAGGENAVRSAHDVSDGGLAVTLAECCFASDGLSADVALIRAGRAKSPRRLRLFGERGARAVVSVSPASLARVRDDCGTIRSSARSESARSRAANSASNMKGAACDRGSAGCVSTSLERSSLARSARKRNDPNLHTIEDDTSTTTAACSASWASGSGQAHLPGPVRACSIAGRNPRGLLRRDGADLHSHKSTGAGAGYFHAGSDCAAARRGGASDTRAIRPPATHALMNAQPIVIDCNKGKLALGHNGNLTNASKWRRKLEHRGSIFQTTSDTEVIVHLIARSAARNLVRSDGGCAESGGGRVFAADADAR